MISQKQWLYKIYSRQTTDTTCYKCASHLVNISVYIVSELLSTKTFRQPRAVVDILPILTDSVGSFWDDFGEQRCRQRHCSPAECLSGYTATEVRSDAPGSCCCGTSSSHRNLMRSTAAAVVTGVTTIRSMMLTFGKIRGGTIQMSSQETAEL